MAQSINTTYEFVQDLLNKNQNGYLGPEEFNRLINQAQYQRFNYLYGMPEQFAAPNFPVPKVAYARTQGIAEALSPFIERVTATFASGSYTLPAGLVHGVALRVGNKKVQRVELDRIASYLDSTINAPSADYPIYCQVDNTYKIYPSTITTAEFEYLRLPNQAVWGYTIVSGVPVYNSGTSTDLEWSTTEINNIVNILLSYFGISTRDSQMIQYAETQKRLGN